MAGFAHKPGVSWTDYTPKVMAKAVGSGRPAVVYFYAEWCGMCNRMNGGTFKDARVIQALEPFEKIGIDMSASGSPENRKLSSSFGIYGFPTFIFFDAQGHQKLKISGYRNAENFLKTVQQFKTKFNITDAPAPARTS